MTWHTLFHLMHLALHFAVWAAGVVCAADYDLFGQTPKRTTRDWTGLEVVVGDPAEAWANRSDCIPCNAGCKAVKNYTTFEGSRWKVAVGSHLMRDGSDAHIAIVKAREGNATPYFNRIERGVCTKTIRGWNGNIEEVIALYPGKMERWTFTSTRPVTTTRIVRTTSPVVVRESYTPRWTWPGDLKTHLAASHGYSWAYLNSLTLDQLEALHDDSHEGRAVRTYAAAPRYVAPSVQTYRQSSGFQMFGVPIMGNYSSGVRSTCPGGICPP